MLEQRNFFLYDESNYVNHTFYSELNKKIQIYGLISTDGIGSQPSKLLTPTNCIKFNVLEKKLKEKIVLQLEDIRRKQKIDVRNEKITNFSILASPKLNKIGEKRKMSYVIIGEVEIGGLQSFDKYDKLNPVEVSIIDSEVNTFLSKYSKNYKYQFIIKKLLFSTALGKETNVIFAGCNGLNDAKVTLINGKVNKALGVININQITNWEKILNKSKWVNVTFNDSQLDPTSSKHFAFGFITNSLYDLLNFEYSLLDNERKLIPFTKGETKVPVLNYTIQIVR